MSVPQSPSLPHLRKGSVDAIPNLLAALRAPALQTILNEVKPGQPTLSAQVNTAEKNIREDASNEILLISRVEALIKLANNCESAAEESKKSIDALHKAIAAVGNAVRDTLNLIRQENKALSEKETKKLFQLQKNRYKDGTRPVTPPQAKPFGSVTSSNPKKPIDSAVIQTGEAQTANASESRVKRFTADTNEVVDVAPIKTNLGTNSAAQVEQKGLSKAQTTNELETQVNQCVAAINGVIKAVSSETNHRSNFTAQAGQGGLSQVQTVNALESQEEQCVANINKLVDAASSETNLELSSTQRESKLVDPSLEALDLYVRLTSSQSNLKQKLEGSLQKAIQTLTSKELKSLMKSLKDRDMSVSSQANSTTLSDFIYERPKAFQSADPNKRDTIECCKDLLAIKRYEQESTWSAIGWWKLLAWIPGPGWIGWGIAALVRNNRAQSKQEAAEEYFNEKKASLAAGQTQSSTAVVLDSSGSRSEPIPTQGESLTHQEKQQHLNIPPATMTENSLSGSPVSQPSSRSASLSVSPPDSRSASTPLPEPVSRNSVSLSGGSGSN